MEVAGNILEYLAYWFKQILDAIEKVMKRFDINVEETSSEA